MDALTLDYNHIDFLLPSTIQRGSSIRFRFFQPRKIKTQHYTLYDLGCVVVLQSFIQDVISYKTHEKY